jgi:hypothetical protein
LIKAFCKKIFKEPPTIPSQPASDHASLAARQQSLGSIRLIRTALKPDMVNESQLVWKWDIRARRKRLLFG